MVATRRLQIDAILAGRMAQPTPKNMDEFFESIFGIHPPKRGTGYELLVAAVLKLAGLAEVVRHDVFLRGETSGTKYQLDGHVAGEGGTMVEAKDYLQRGAPVGRGDIQKLAGALLDLDVARGMLASATGFSQPTKRYAGGSKRGRNMKPIELLDVRPSRASDDEGRIKTIEAEVILHSLDFSRATWFVQLTADSIAQLCARGGGEQKARFDMFYDECGRELQSVEDFSVEIQRDRVDPFAATMSGEHRFDRGAFIHVGDVLAQVEFIRFSVPYVEHVQRITIESGTPRVLIRSHDGKVNTLITEEQLKLVRFSEDGSVSLVGEVLVAVRPSHKP